MMYLPIIFYISIFQHLKQIQKTIIRKHKTTIWIIIVLFYYVFITAKP